MGDSHAKMDIKSAERKLIDRKYSTECLDDYTMSLPRALVIESDRPSPVPVSYSLHSRPAVHKPDAQHVQDASMLELLEVIQQKVNFLTGNHGFRGPLGSAIHDEDQIQKHRSDLLAATQSLHDLALGPRGILESIHVSLDAVILPLLPELILIASPTMLFACKQSTDTR